MASNDTLVSIVVPVYGTEAYLPSCIDSICNQSYKNIQIILVDDQSPDRCPEICDSYAQKESRILVVHQENKGVSGARNTGMCHASGEYIMFVDSDDMLPSDAVEVLLRDACNFGADIVSGMANRIDEEGRLISPCANVGCAVFRDEHSLVLSLQGNENTNSVWAKLFKAAFIRDIHFEEGKNINEDGFYMFQCYLKKPILVQHNVVVYHYISRPGSGSRQVFSDKYLSMLYFCDRKKELIAAQYPQYMHLSHNMEVRTNLFLLDVLCSTTEKKYRAIQRQCVNTVRRLYRYHRPINEHQRMQAFIVKYGLYPLYKTAVRIKYYR